MTVSSSGSSLVHTHIPVSDTPAGSEN